MTRIRMIAVLSLGALALVVAFGSLAYRSASAASPTPTAAASSDDTGDLPDDSTDEAETTETRPHDKRGDMERSHPDDTSDEDLAAALGITVDELTAARQAAYETALAQAVEQGLITQEEADEMTSGKTTRPFGRHGLPGLKDSEIDTQALLADALGISVDQLEEAYTQVFIARLDQAVADGDLTQEQADLMQGQRALAADETFQTSIQSAYEAAINQAVADGVITQAQADLILAQTVDRGVPGFGGHFPGGPDGFAPGQHGGPGR